MADLTQGSLHHQIARMASTMLVGMVFQTLYYLVDLYFVAGVGTAAVAAVSLIGNLMMITVALTQALTVGATSLIARAFGSKDFALANRLFNQTQVLAVLTGAVFVTVLMLGRHAFAERFAADAETAAAAVAYLNWFVPALGLQFLIVAMAAALRGAGEVKGPMLVQVVSLIMNTVLAPVLIAGWGTGKPMGVAGAGLATFLSVLFAGLLLLVFVRKRHDVLDFNWAHSIPDWALWRKLLSIGLPSGAEFLLISVYSLVIYYLIRDFGAHAQAGFGLGMRIMQAGFLPALAVAFSVGPIAGQNFGAGKLERVRATFKAGALWVSILMLLFVLACHVLPDSLFTPFSQDPAVITVGAGMLAVLSYNFVAAGLILVVGGMFQALGNTVPSMLASASRLILFVGPAVWMVGQSWFRLTHLWWLSVGTQLIQLFIALLLLRREFRRRLVPPGSGATAMPSV
ncbi:MATE family efflux transporter [Ahniella affigens]|uniref:Multidrug-efflux transporter n=1 Tax=Ahniella affigens TaxID=2021234 RepID=A0A2P1PQ41_9GAMM|nr:MATE family efflux transporter [Ahniella affigens]AVP96963.1 MATE family efflux transporter [Ahniella affigens]